MFKVYVVIVDEHPRHGVGELKRDLLAEFDSDEEAEEYVAYLADLGGVPDDLDEDEDDDS